MLGALALTHELGSALRGQAVADARDASAVYVHGVLDPLFAQDARLTGVREDPRLGGDTGYNANGTVVLLSTIPPRSGMLEKSEKFAKAARNVGKELNVPICDYFARLGVSSDRERVLEELWACYAPDLPED